MSATEAQIAQIRRMVNEPTETNYDDDAVAVYIEACPLIDTEGRDTDHASYVDTYDLNCAAANIWAEKTAALAGSYDFDSDGGAFNRSQMFEQAKKMATYYKSRSAITAITLHQTPRENDFIEEDFTDAIGSIN